MRKKWNQQCYEDFTFKWCITKLSLFCWASISGLPCQPAVLSLRCLWKLTTPRTMSYTTENSHLPSVKQRQHQTSAVSKFALYPGIQSPSAIWVTNSNQIQAVLSLQKVSNFRPYQGFTVSPNNTSVEKLNTCMQINTYINIAYICKQKCTHAYV